MGQAVEERKASVLAINDAYEGGGAEIVFQKTAEFLRKQGHSVVLYAKKRFPKTEWRDLFRYIYSFRVDRKLRSLLEQKKPDIVHLHNFYHYLSPSILNYLLREKRKRNFKVVMTVHDYHFLCANNGCVRWRNGEAKVCEDCRGKRYYNILLKGCDPRGFLYNALKFFQHFVAYNLFSLEQAIDCFVVPSIFLKEKLKGFCDERKIVILNNPAFSLEQKLPEVQSFAKGLQKEFQSVFIGRLDPAKGLEHFISEDYRPDTHGAFAIIGSGDAKYEEQLRRLILKKGYSNCITMLGRKSHVEALAYLYRAKRLIFCSLCYENCPLTVLEARVLGKEVFHYGKGAIREMLSLDKKSLLESAYAEEISVLFNTLSFPDYESFSKGLRIGSG